MYKIGPGHIQHLSVNTFDSLVITCMLSGWQVVANYYEYNLIRVLGAFSASGGPGSHRWCVLRRPAQCHQAWKYLHM